MKKTINVFTIIFMILSLAGVVGGTVYLFIHMTTLATLLASLASGGEAENVGYFVGTSIMFLAIIVYFGFAAVTGLLTKRVVEADATDKITKFGILSIIFFNPVGGILAIVYNRQLCKELERTAPKGKRKDIEKNEA